MMNTKPNVSGREAMAIAAVYGGVFVYLGLPRQLVQLAGEAAWMAVAIAGIASLAASYKGCGGQTTCRWVPGAGHRPPRRS